MLLPHEEPTSLLHASEILFQFCHNLNDHVDTHCLNQPFASRFVYIWGLWHGEKPQTLEDSNPIQHWRLTYSKSPKIAWPLYGASPPKECQLVQFHEGSEGSGNSSAAQPDLTMLMFGKHIPPALQEPMPSLAIDCKAANQPWHVFESLLVASSFTATPLRDTLVAPQTRK